MSGKSLPLGSQEEVATAWQGEEDAQAAREASERSAQMEADPERWVRAVMAQAAAVVEVVDGSDELRTYIRETIGGRQPFTRAQGIFAAKLGRRDLLIEHNMLLVVDTALRWWRAGRSLMDLIGAGNEGLVRAAAKFDPALGYAFSTFGLYVIGSHVRAEAYRQDTQFATMPIINQRTLGALYSQRNKLNRASGSDFTIEEIAALLRRSTITPPQHAAPWPEPEELGHWLATTRASYLSRVSHAKDPSWHPHSAETLADQIADPSTEGLDRAEARADIWALSRDLGTLTRYHVISKADLRLLVLRFGIPHPDPAWKPPAGWRLGRAVSLRDMARLAHRKRESARQDFYRALEALDSDPSEIAHRASATIHSTDIFARFYASS